MPIEDFGSIVQSPAMSANASHVRPAGHTVDATPMERDSAAPPQLKKPETMIQALLRRETQGTRTLRPLRDIEKSSLGARTTNTMSHDQGWRFAQGIEYNRLSKDLKRALPGDRPGLHEYALSREVEHLRIRQNDLLTGWGGVNGNSYAVRGYAHFLSKLPKDEALNTELYKQLFSSAKEIENSNIRADVLQFFASSRPINQGYADAQAEELLAEAQRLPDTSAAQRILRTLMANC